MLKKIALTKRRATAMAALRELRAKRTQLRADETELQKQIDESDDVSEELIAKVDQLEKDRDETGEAIDKLEKEIEDIDAKLAELDDGGDPDDPDGTGTTDSRSSGGPSNRRAITTPTSNPGYRSRSRCYPVYGKPGGRIPCDGKRKKSHPKSCILCTTESAADGDCG